MMCCSFSLYDQQGHVFTAMLLLAWFYSSLYSWSFQCDLGRCDYSLHGHSCSAPHTRFHCFFLQKAKFTSLIVFHFFLLPQRKTSGGMHILTIFFRSGLSSHFSFLVLLPRLRAEEPQCLLLTFSYHLSRFHRHHYSPCFLPFLWAPGLFSSHIICVLQSHQYSPSPARSTLSSAPPSYFPIPIHHFITAP